MFSLWLSIFDWMFWCHSTSCRNNESAQNSHYRLKSDVSLIFSLLAVTLRTIRTSRTFTAIVADVSFRRWSLDRRLEAQHSNHSLKETVKSSNGSNWNMRRCVRQSGIVRIPIALTHDQKKNFRPIAFYINSHAMSKFNSF